MFEYFSENLAPGLHRSSQLADCPKVHIVKPLSIMMLSVNVHINALLHIGLINFVCLTAMTLYYLNDVVNDIKSTRKSNITSLSLV